MSLVSSSGVAYSEQELDHRVSRLREVRGVLDHVGRGVLLGLANSEALEIKITRNFIAKSLSLVRSIFELWPSRSHQDCRILYRALIDRLLYVNHLFRINGFKDFDDWSFVQRYGMICRLRSDVLYLHQTEDSPPPSEEDKARWKLLKGTGLKWQIPSAEDMARNIGREYLYHYGYNYGSMSVHPISTDGLEDFESITGLRSEIDFPAQEDILQNSVLVMWLLLNDSLHHTTLTQKAALMHCLEQIFEELDNGSYNYWDWYAQLIEIHKQGHSWFTMKDFTVPSAA